MRCDLPWGRDGVGPPNLPDIHPRRPSQGPTSSHHPNALIALKPAKGMGPSSSLSPPSLACCGLVTISSFLLSPPSSCPLPLPPPLLSPAAGWSRSPPASPLPLCPPPPPLPRLLRAGDDLLLHARNVHARLGRLVDGQLAAVGGEQVVDVLVVAAGREGGGEGGRGWKRYSYSLREQPVSGSGPQMEGGRPQPEARRGSAANKGGRAKESPTRAGRSQLEVCDAQQELPPHRRCDEVEYARDAELGDARLGRVPHHRVRLQGRGERGAGGI